MKDIEWSEKSLDDLAALDKEIVHRIVAAVERFSQTGSGNLKKLQGINPPEFRLRVGDYRVRFYIDSGTMRILRILNRKDAYR